MKLCTKSVIRGVCLPSPYCIYQAWPEYSGIPWQQLPWREQYLCRGREKTQNTFTVALTCTTSPSYLSSFHPPTPDTCTHKKEGGRHKHRIVCERDHKGIIKSMESLLQVVEALSVNQVWFHSVVSQLKWRYKLNGYLTQHSHLCFQKLALRWCHQVSESRLSLPPQSSSPQYDPWLTHQHWNTHILPLFVDTKGSSACKQLTKHIITTIVL